MGQLQEYYENKILSGEKMFLKKNKAIGNMRYVALDDSEFNYDIDVKTARLNYEKYQNDLKQRQQNLIKKWNKEIIDVSNKGEKFFMTNQFMTDDDKDKILFMFDNANCCINLPSDATLQYFKEYYESKGFKVIKIQYNNNICCLKIIWISSNNNEFQEV